MSTKTTQWTTTTKRTVRRPKDSDVDMSELDEILMAGKWDAMIRDVEHMPLNKARELRAKLNNLFAT